MVGGDGCVWITDSDIQMGVSYLAMIRLIMQERFAEILMQEFVLTDF